MLLIFSTLELIRNLWQLKTAVFLHWCLIRAVPLTSARTPTSRSFIHLVRRDRRPARGRLIRREARGRWGWPRGRRCEAGSRIPAKVSCSLRRIWKSEVKCEISTTTLGQMTLDLTTIGGQTALDLMPFDLTTFGLRALFFDYYAECHGKPLL